MTKSATHNALTRGPFIGRVHAVDIDFSPKPTRANVSADSNRGNPSRGKAVLRQRNNVQLPSAI